MKVKVLKYNNKDSLIIYMTKEERNNEILIEKITEYKKLYGNISIFISGNNQIENVLTKIVQEKI